MGWRSKRWIAVAVAAARAVLAAVCGQPALATITLKQPVSAQHRQRGPADSPGGTG